MAKASFLLRPRWLLSHLFVLVLVVVMVRLGFWQLDRLDQRQERNDLLTSRQEEPAVPVEDLLPADAGGAAVDAARYRTVTVTGTYEPGETVVIYNRSQDGVPGAWLLTPMVLESGDRVAVIRGFVSGDPQRLEGDAAYDPPSGGVTVTGTVVSPTGLDGTAPQDVDPVLERPDTLPGLVMAQESEPPESSPELVTVPLPDLTEGPHLSYAVQWFIFSTIAAVGYPIVLWRLVQRRAGAAATESAQDAQSQSGVHVAE